MMQWGMPTMLDCADLEANAALCRRLGMQFVEINMNLPMYQADALKQAKLLSDRYGIGFTIHLDENFVPADFNPLVSEAYFETMRRTLRAALEIGAPVVNMHLSRGIHFKLPDRVVYLFDRYREEYLSRIRVLRSLCEREIGGRGLRVCIENTNGYLDFQKEAVALMLESDVFALTWDIGHSYTAELDDVPFLMANRGRLAHFHIHDALNRRCHLTLGEGEMELTKMLSMAKDCGARCVVETKTPAALEKSVAWLRESSWMDAETATKFV